MKFIKNNLKLYTIISSLSILGTCYLNFSSVATAAAVTTVPTREVLTYDKNTISTNSSKQNKVTDTSTNKAKNKKEKNTIPKRDATITEDKKTSKNVNSTSTESTNANVSIETTNTANTAHINNEKKSEEKSVDSLKAIILNWEEIPNAVMYELLIKDADTDKIVFNKYDIYAAGYQLDSSQADLSQKLTWQVRGLDENKTPVSDYTEAKWLNIGKTFTNNWQSREILFSQEATSEIDYTIYLVKNSVTVNPLKIITHFSEMDYVPVYPVYSWVPVKNTKYYNIDIYYQDANGAAKKIRTLKSPQNIDYYDDNAYTKAGKYYFNIQAYDDAQHKLAESVNSYFTVTNDNVKIAALGDSITHGGGAISTPPSATLYNWETYADTPILNIGFSGNLTINMLNRFDKDVLPFSPKILVIMGGVNDIRTGIKADTVISNLQAIKEKCVKHNIIPVFLTVTPMNPQRMVNIGKIEAPSSNWQKEREEINKWITTQEHYVDVAKDMVDEQGYLKDTLTTDGLHPDYEGKKHIGEMVGNYLKLNFSYML